MKNYKKQKKNERKQKQTIKRIRTAFNVFDLLDADDRNYSAFKVRLMHKKHTYQTGSAKASGLYGRVKPTARKVIVMHPLTENFKGEIVQMTNYERSQYFRRKYGSKRARLTVAA